MKCPRCHEALQSGGYEKVTVHHCEECGGVFLGKGDLQSILEARKEDFPQQLIEKTLKEAHAGLSKADEADILDCANCSSKMKPVNYDYSSGVVVNVCPTGDGIWFDKDELEQAQIYMEHWDQQEDKDRAKWIQLARKAQAEENAQLDKIDGEVRATMGPVSRLFSNVLHEFKAASGDD